MSPVRAQVPKLVIAGPGAGKTHDMVSRIIEALPSLSPFRYLAAVTFTNTAANNIRERIHRLARPGPNVFIGTIHSFVNRFVIAPFARPLQRLPNDRIFAAVEISDPKFVGTKRQLSPAGRNARRIAIIKKLLGKGVVPYEQMAPLACELLNNKAILDRVSRRLQFLFIDEFQDVDTQQFEIFDKLRKANYTQICAVGDPEQFIYSFIYGMRGVRAPTFEKIPFFRFGDLAVCEPMDVNHRSCKEIVDFTNRFRTEPRQRSLIGARGEPRVLLLPEMKLPIIIDHFRHLSDTISVRRGQINRLYLAYENRAFDEVREQFGIRHYSNSIRQHRTLLQDALELLALCRGRSQIGTQEELLITNHEWRMWGVALLKALRDTQFPTAEEFAAFWLPKLGVASGLAERQKTVYDTFGQLQSAVVAGGHKYHGDWSCSIHRAKGLEANSVLVLASGVKELNQWCTTDRAERNSDKRDTCRVGFVGFTRAMELLCIACRDPIGSETRMNLETLGVKISLAIDIPPTPTNSKGADVQGVSEE
jgi:DNA helicase II / ATP-dependent DNA helicase PcrA